MGPPQRGDETGLASRDFTGETPVPREFMGETPTTRKFTGETPTTRGFMAGRRFSLGELSRAQSWVERVAERVAEEIR